MSEHVKMHPSQARRMFIIARKAVSPNLPHQAHANAFRVAWTEQCRRLDEMARAAAIQARSGLEGSAR